MLFGSVLFVYFLESVLFLYIYFTFSMKPNMYLNETMYNNTSFHCLF